MAIEQAGGNMHIVVCMKQVPRDNSVKINPDLSINAEGIEQIMNLFDEYAVEEGLEWNEKLGGKVTILSLGPEEWKEHIRRGPSRRRCDPEARRCRPDHLRAQLDR